MLMSKHVNAEEEQLRKEIAALSDIERQAFYAAVRRELKDPDTYAVLNWFLICGLHHFYLRRWLRGAVNLVVFVVAAVLIKTGFGVIGGPLLLGILAIELLALFRSQIIVQDANNKIYRRRLQQLHGEPV